jgi:hypothetical protein
MNSRAATLSVLSGRSKGAFVDGSNSLILTDAELPEVKELRLP